MAASPELIESLSMLHGTSIEDTERISSIADEIGDQLNNPGIAGSFRLYFLVAVKHGYDVVPKT